MLFNHPIKFSVDEIHNDQITLENQKDYYLYIDLLSKCVQYKTNKKFYLLSDLSLANNECFRNDLYDRDEIHSLYKA